MDHIGDGSPQGGVDWQTVRRILLRAMPDWQPVNMSDPKPGDDANLRAYSLCQAILEAYPKLEFLLLAPTLAIAALCAPTLLGLLLYRAFGNAMGIR